MRVGKFLRNRVLERVLVLTLETLGRAGFLAWSSVDKRAFQSDFWQDFRPDEVASDQGLVRLNRGMIVNPQVVEELHGEVFHHEDLDMESGRRCSLCSSLRMRLWKNLVHRRYTRATLSNLGVHVPRCSSFRSGNAGISERASPIRRTAIGENHSWLSGFVRNLIFRLNPAVIC